MEYDFFKMAKKGLNWTKPLPECQRILNEEPKDGLMYKSPFEVYFARKPSSHTNRAMESEDLVSEELVTNAGRCNPTCKDRYHVVVEELKMSEKWLMLRLNVAIEEWLRRT